MPDPTEILEPDYDVAPARRLPVDPIPDVSDTETALDELSGDDTAAIEEARSNPGEVVAEEELQGDVNEASS